MSREDITGKEESEIRRNKAMEGVESQGKKLVLDVPAHWEPAEGYHMSRNVTLSKQQ